MTLDFPKGGSGEIVHALVRGVTKTGGGRVLTRHHVEEVIVEGGAAVGVRVRDLRGKAIKTILAKRAVVSNIDMWNTRQLVKEGGSDAFDVMMSDMLKTTPKLASFIHYQRKPQLTSLHSGL